MTRVPVLRFVQQNFSTVGIFILVGAANLKDRKGWLPSAKLKPTFTFFFGRDFAIFNTFSWQNPYQEK